MTRAPCVLAILSSFVAFPCLADQFQLVGADGSFVRYETVVVKDQQGAHVATGYTDRFGRFTLRSLPNGVYRAEMKLGVATLRIDGETQLKRVAVR